MRELLTPKELAAKLKCSKELVYKMAKARRIPVVRLFSDMRFDAAAIDKIIEQKTIKQR